MEVGKFVANKCHNVKVFIQNRCIIGNGKASGCSFGSVSRSATTVVVVEALKKNSKVSYVARSR